MNISPSEDFAGAYYPMTRDPNDPVDLPADPMKQQTVAVIPAYNEAVAIGSVILRTAAHAGRVIVVDDGSTDTTAWIAGMAGAEVISLGRNCGKAAAVMAGLKAARASDPKAVVLIDGDGQHNPAEIPVLVGPVFNGLADLVIGSRSLGKNGTTPIYRKVGQKTLDAVTRIQANVSVTDSQSGFRALSGKALDHLDFVSDGYNLESDMIAHFSKRGLVITEVPVSAAYDVPHMHKKNAFSHGYDVLSAIITEIGYSRPLLLFGTLGALFIFTGLVAGFWSISYYSTFSMLPFGPALAAGIFLMVGLILFTSGLILNYLVIMMKKNGY